MHLRCKAEITHAVYFEIRERIEAAEKEPIYLHLSSRKGSFKAAHCLYSYLRHCCPKEVYTVIEERLEGAGIYVALGGKKS